MIKSIEILHLLFTSSQDYVRYESFPLKLLGFSTSDILRGVLAGLKPGGPQQ